VPYVADCEQTVRSLKACGVTPTCVDVAAGAEAYSAAFASWWGAGEPFCVVEHDMEATPEAVVEAQECGCGWGVSPYEGPGGVTLRQSLGFTRFSARFVEEHPGIGEQLRGVPWGMLDARLVDALRAEGCAPHLHAPVVHHHVYGERCVCGEGHKWRNG